MFSSISISCLQSLIGAWRLPSYSMHCSWCRCTTWNWSKCRGKVQGTILFGWHPFLFRLFYSCEGLKFEGIQPPAEVIQQLQATFTEREEGTKRTRIILSSRMKDKICLHLLVLCLFIDDFSVEFLHLQRDLKISERKCVQMQHYCHYYSDGHSEWLLCCGCC